VVERSRCDLFLTLDNVLRRKASRSDKKCTTPASLYRGVRHSEDLAIDVVGLYFDYSKNHRSSETMRLPIGLAAVCWSQKHLDETKPQRPDEYAHSALASYQSGNGMRAAAKNVSLSAAFRPKVPKTRVVTFQSPPPLLRHRSTRESVRELAAAGRLQTFFRSTSWRM
jgi:hypothetical protein